MSLREWLILGGALLVALILFDGWRRISGRRRRLKIEIDPSIKGIGSENEGHNPELPNGGARVKSHEELSAASDTHSSGDQLRDSAEIDAAVAEMNADIDREASLLSGLSARRDIEDLPEPTDSGEFISKPRVAKPASSPSTKPVPVPVPDNQFAADPDSFSIDQAVDSKAASNHTDNTVLDTESVITDFSDHSSTSNTTDTEAEPTPSFTETAAKPFSETHSETYSETTVEIESEAEPAQQKVSVEEGTVLSTESVHQDEILNHPASPDSFADEKEGAIFDDIRISAQQDSIAVYEDLSEELSEASPDTDQTCLDESPVDVLEAASTESTETLDSTFEPAQNSETETDYSVLSTSEIEQKSDLGAAREAETAQSIDAVRESKLHAQELPPHTSAPKKDSEPVQQGVIEDLFSIPDLDFDRPIHEILDMDLEDEPEVKHVPTKTARKAKAKAELQQTDSLFDSLLDQVDRSEEPPLDDIDSLVNTETSANDAEESDDIEQLPVTSGTRQLRELDFSDPDASLAIFVVAPKGEHLSGSALRQVAQACGMEFGQQNLFHRYEDESERSPIQFSMSDAVKPGYFDLNTMDEHQTPAVSLFMSMSEPRDPMYAYECMLATAETLARNLHADLLDSDRSVLRSQTKEHYRERVSSFQLKKRASRRSR